MTQQHRFTGACPSARGGAEFVFVGYCNPTEKGVTFHANVWREGAFVGRTDGALQERPGNIDYLVLAESRVKIFIRDQLDRAN